MSKLKWSYKTVHFELKREGLLGGSFLDETEIEQQLNDFGRSGWELISVIEVQDGIIAFFKQSLDFGFSSLPEERVEPENDQVGNVGEAYRADEVQELDDVYEADEVQEIDNVYSADRVQQADDIYNDQRYEPEDQQADEFEPNEQDDRSHEENDFADQEDSGYASSVNRDDYDEFVEEPQHEHGDQDNSDEQQEHHIQRGIGAIRIE